MSNQLFSQGPTWEEVASDLPKATEAIYRVLAIFSYLLENEKTDSADVSTVLDYFRRAQWPQPTNISSLTNHCAGKGWLSQVGETKGKKIWRITRKGYDAFKSKTNESAKGGKTEEVEAIRAKEINHPVMVKSHVRRKRNEDKLKF